MSGDEPRRSGRATKGQHNKHESPEPKAKAEKKSGKKGKKTAAVEEDEEEAGEEAEEAEEIRCICGNDNPADKRAFIGCDACSVWQHNVCMGMPDDEDDVPEHYFCEECRPEEHGETLEALEAGVKIWETRNKIYQNEKKKSKSRKSKGGEETPGWLRREGANPSAVVKEETPASTVETGSKRKRAVKEEEEVEETKPEKPARGRLEKRRKAEAKPDPDTALVELERLPENRQRVAKALTTIIAADIKDRVKSGAHKLATGETPECQAEHYALRIEYSLHINHGGPTTAEYGAQFRTLNANLKKNKTLIQELLAGHLTPDELSTMSSSDMASEELQKERAEMKAEADRQTVIDRRDEGPRYRRTHKGDEIVEGETAATSSAPVSRPVRHSVTEADITESPVNNAASPKADGPDERRASKDNFDVKDIWAKTGTDAQPRPVPNRQRSVAEPQPNNGTKVDADVDRLLADDDEEYAPTDYPEGIVWRGKIVHTTGDLEPVVNARWVAGRDVSQTIPWKDLLADRLNIDGRLQIQKAEEYLCGLQWSKTSDVSVLAMTAYDDAKAFDDVFTYFKSRDRYAVVHKDKPALLVKDLYIIPVETGSKLPEHVSMLEHCTLKQPVEEKVLLATFVVSRAPIESPQKQPEAASAEAGNGRYAPNRALSFPGPAASPINPVGAAVSPFNPSTASPFNANGPTASPLNPTAPQFGQDFNTYTPQGYPTQYQTQGYPVGYGQPTIAPHNLQMAVSILGEAAYCTSAQRILMESTTITVDQVEHIKKIFTDEPNTRTDFDAFCRALGLLPAA